MAVQAEDRSSAKPDVAASGRGFPRSAMSGRPTTLQTGRLKDCFTLEPVGRATPTPRLERPVMFPCLQPFGNDRSVWHRL